MRYYKQPQVHWEIPPFESLTDHETIKALMAYDNGDDAPLKALHIATTFPCLRIRGWEVPYQEYLNRYFVKTKYYGILEVFALNKTDIRKPQYRGERFTPIYEIICVEERRTR